LDSTHKRGAIGKQANSPNRISSQFSNKSGRMIFEGKILLTTDELAEYLRVSESTIYRLIQKGTIHGFKRRGDWHFARANIDRWIEERESDYLKASAMKPEPRRGRKARR
jgi:excisionase family DNA binding protein